MMKCISTFMAFAAFFISLHEPAAAQTLDKTVRIGALGNQTGVSADIGGVGGVAAAQMAIEDSGLLKEGWKIDVVSADHQSKPDLAANIARRWIDVDKVDILVDLGNSAVALAAASLAKSQNIVAIVSSAGTTELTGAQCSPNTVHWTYDTYMLANGTAKTLLDQGGDSWYFILADYAFGYAMEKEASSVVTANNGKVLGRIKHPINTSDFASFLLQAQSSGAKVIALANTGNDSITAIKQASEFGIVSGGQKLTGLLLFITDVNGVGLDIAQGLYLTEAFYWDMNDQTRAFTKRFQERYSRSVPTSAMAGIYASTLHYLKALKALGGNPHDGRAVVAKMKELPTDDTLFGRGSIRADGRALHPAYLFQVKSPSESKYPWDYYKLRAAIPAEEAALPLAASECPLVRK